MSHSDHRIIPHQVLSRQRQDCKPGRQFSILAPKVLPATDGKEIAVAIRYVLTNRTLRNLIAEGKACCATLLECPATYHRESHAAHAVDIENILLLKRGEWSGTISLTPHVVLTSGIPGSAAPEHSQAIQSSAPDGTNLPAGAILAAGETAEIKLESEPSIESIFSFDPNPQIPAGTFATELKGKRISINLHPGDLDRMSTAQNRGQQESLQQALQLYALDRAIRNLPRDPTGWARAVQNKLEEHGIRGYADKLAEKSEIYAQMILQNPLARMLEIIGREHRDEYPISVYRLTGDAFQSLEEEAENHPELWQRPGTDFAEALRKRGITHYQEPAGVTAQEPISLDPPPIHRPNLADGQALKFHRNLAGMTPAKAADPNLLAWLNHFVLHDYGIRRWPRPPKSEPADHILRHWLTRSASEIYESSIAGRTYWMAETCLKAARHSRGAFTAGQALTLFSNRAERYHRCMEFKAARNPRVAAEYIRVMLNEAENINSRGVRTMIQHINSETEDRLIDILEQERINATMVEAARTAMKDRRNRGYPKGIPMFGGIREEIQGP